MVRVTETCRVAYEGAVVELTEGQEVPAGEFADYLLATGAPVEGEPRASDEGADGETQAGPPTVNAPKADWVAHVVQVHGLDEQEAAALTKADLIGLVKDGGPGAAAAGESG